jgi:hypothetical protein
MLRWLIIPNRNCGDSKYARHWFTNNLILSFHCELLYSGISLEHFRAEFFQPIVDLLVNPFRIGVKVFTFISSPPIWTLPRGSVEPRMGFGWRRQRRPQIKGDPGRSQGLPLVPSTWRSTRDPPKATTGVSFGRASVQQHIYLSVASRPKHKGASRI